MALFFHSIASYVMAECACPSLIFTSFTDVPFVFGLCGYKVFELVPFFCVFPFTYVLVDGLGLIAADENFAFVRADFHAVCSCCFLQSFSELLS